MFSSNRRLDHVLRFSRRLGGFRAVALFAMVILALSPLYSWPHSTWIPTTTTTPLPESLPATPSPSPILDNQTRNTSPALKGPPTQSFKDNLLSNTTYITSWPGSGWTNDVMTYMNLIYLALLTQRVPIIPHFTPGWVTGSSIEFGLVFDVPKLSEALGIPILEWHGVKDPQSTTVDTLGCWNIWQTVQDDVAKPRDSAAPGDLGLDISYTQTPRWVRLYEQGNQNHATFWALARLGFPQGQRMAQEQAPTLPAPLSGQVIKPDSQLLCMDYLYYVCAHQAYEFDHDFSPAWRFVGTHMYWNEALLNLAALYLENTIGATSSGEIPPWISIHVRHNDFQQYCGKWTLDECYAPLSVIARRVQEVKDELLATKGFVVEHVIMTSDERNETWWKDVAAYGWYRVDHSHTVEEWGAWYPVLIDAVIQSLASGFVGTTGSTMSLIAARRVENWQQGPTRMFKWGYPGADDH
ncbi:hypothetical protein DL96DRAFT_1499772 [Flagelloscypha sp. PMI_526]|nr:hypothetical protein DL96DRAFT_1499772 [Flagelloscypha sp. PMI_526]